MVQGPVQQRHCGRLPGQEAAPRFEGSSTGHSEAAALEGGHEAEEQATPHVVQWREAEVVHDNEVVLKQTMEDAAG